MKERGLEELRGEHGLPADNTDYYSESVVFDGNFDSIESEGL